MCNAYKEEYEDYYYGYEEEQECVEDANTEMSVSGVG